MEPRLKSFYKSQILPELKNSLGVKNTMQVPKVLKIVINMGLGLDANDNKILKNIETDLANITGQKPVITKSKKAISNFKKEKLQKNSIQFQRYASLRYLGQDHSVEVLLPSGKYDKKELNKILTSFHKQYEKEFTYSLDNPVELIQFHLVAIAKIDKPKLEKRKKTGRKVREAIKSKRKVDFDQLGERISDIYDFDKLEPNMVFNGPAIVEDSSTTVVIFPGQRCKVDDFANLHINTQKKK